MLSAFLWLSVFSAWLLRGGHEDLSLPLKGWLGYCNQMLLTRRIPSQIEMHVAHLTRSGLRAAYALPCLKIF